MTSIGNEMEAALLRQVEYLKETKKALQDEDGNPPPRLVAKADQFIAEGKELLGIFIQYAQEHRAKSAQEKCCLDNPSCIGSEVMLAISTSAEVMLSHLLMAFTVAVRKLADLPSEREGDPRDGA